jgi:hypothetical protein
MCHPSQSRSPTPLSTFLRGALLRDCGHSTAGEDMEEAQQMPQNDDHDHRKEENNKEEEEDNKVESEEDEDYTPWSNTEKDETFHDADEIKTFGDEALIPTGRLRDLLNRINITTPPEFRIKRIPRPG